jgi:hypothetical protein
MALSLRSLAVVSGVWVLAATACGGRVDLSGGNSSSGSSGASSSGSSGSSGASSSGSSGSSGASSSGSSGASSSGSSGASSSGSSGASSSGSSGASSSGSSGPPPPGLCPDTTATAASVLATLNAPPPVGMGQYRATPPSAQQCSDQSITDFDQYVVANPGTPSVLRSALMAIDPVCASCIVKDLVGPTWGPVLLGPSDKLYSNVAGAFDSRGLSRRCAVALHFYTQCAEVVCNACSVADRDQCLQDEQQQGSICEGLFAGRLMAGCSTPAEQNSIQATQDVIQTLVQPPYNLRTAVGVFGRIACGSPVP